MHKITIGIQEGNRGFLDRRIADGSGQAPLTGERSVAANVPEDAAAMPGDLDGRAVRQEGGEEFVVSVAYDVKGGDAADRDTGDPSLPLGGRAEAQKGDVHVAQPLGVHQAGVSDTGFVKCEVCETLGMGQLAEMASFSAQSGEAFAVRRASVFSDREEPAPFTSAGKEADTGGEPVVENGGNTAPVAGGAADLGSMNEDAALLVTEAELLALSSDIDGDTLTVTGLTVASGSGFLADNGDGTWTFTPTADWNGAVSFSYAVGDGQGGAVQAEATLTVDPVNDAPEVGGFVDLGSMNEDGGLVITEAELLALASDIDGDTLTVTGLAVASGSGSLADNGDGTWTFTPTGDWNGAVSFDYAVSDGQGCTVPATAILAVSPVNDAPEVSGSVDLGSMNEDGNLAITAAELLAQPSDIDGDTLSVTGLTVATGIGSLADNGDGSWTFTPTADWNGSVSFDYTVSDGQGGTAPASANLIVNAVNDAPVVSGSVDLGSMNEDGSLVVTAAELLVQSSDIDGDTLSVTGLTVASGSGSLADNGNGTWTFSPTADWNGSVSFDYTVSDGQGGTAPGTATLAVNPVNDAPAVSGQVALDAMNEDESLVITSAQLLAQASDADGDTLSVSGLTMDSGNGSLADNGDGTWTFTPTSDWNGAVSYSYTVSDGQGGTAPASANLAVSPVNDAPVVSGPIELGSMNEDGSLVITQAELLAQSSDIDGDTLSVTGLTVATGNGSLADNGDGSWTFTPAADWNGSVSFGYTVSDGQGGTDAASANLTVSPVNDAPVIDVNSLLLVDDLAAQSLAGSLSATDADNDATDLWYTVTQGPANGVLLLDGVAVTDFSQPVFTQADIDNGRVSFRFDIPQPGGESRVMEEDSLVFTVSEGSLSTAETTFGIRNSAVQVWGTDGVDDLRNATDFERAETTFHVYGFDGNDTLRGGAGADILEGGGQSYAATWLYTLDGGDTVDYGASASGVDIDLTRETQSGGHAEGDTLVGMENVTGSAFDDSIVGDAADNLLMGLDGGDTLRGGAGNDTLRGWAGADLLDGGAGQDLADYRTSASWVNVNLNTQDGVTAQSGGGAGNDALGDALVGIEGAVGSNDATHGDVLTGNSGSNLLMGLDGADTLIGGAGNDTLVGGAGADRLDGGIGTRDLTDYSASTAWVSVNLSLQNGTTAQSGGGAGNHAAGDILTAIEDVNGSGYDDSIIGSSVSNVIHGLGGDDTIDGGAGYDTIRGGDGDDLIYGGDREDSLYGDAGNDTIYGGRGLDTIWGGAGDDNLVGGPDDTSPDVLFGGTGNDTLVATSGLAARDTLVGCQGADRLIGDGDSAVSYEITDDYFTVNFTPVYLDLRIQDGVTAQSGGPEGNDAIGDILTGIRHAAGTGGSDTLIGNHEGNEFYGQDGDDLIIGGAGNDSLWGENGNDTLEGGEGADFLWGGMGYDMVSYENAAQGVSIDLRAMGQVSGAWQSGAGEENGDDIWHVDGIIGSNHDDTLIATNNDYADYISINNRLMGLDGDDILMGLSAGDTLDGGAGRDTADYSLSTSAVRIDLALQDGAAVQSGGAAGNDGDGDVLISIENVTGSAFDDTLVGDAGDNVLNGMGGSDVLMGAAGDDTLVAVAGDTLDGGSGFDTFRLADDAGTGGLLDLSAMTDAGRITGIEAVDITGDADDANTLALTAADVLDMTGGTDTLWVQGDANDTVTTTDAGWILAGTQAGADGHTYNHYTGYAGATLVNLLIDTDIAAQNVS